MEKQEQNENKEQRICKEGLVIESFADNVSSKHFAEGRNLILEKD